MIFVSYAQNFEDVMLWRALSTVENGFYIDVGANHPILDSVTKAFYEQGWSGTNIEPLQQHIEELQQDRPRDINLQIALSNHTGEAEIIVPELRGLASLDHEMKQRYADESYQSQTVTVHVTTLEAIWQEHVGDRAVHFLKIDVEGHEKQVLEGLDLTQHRPWIMVIESTLPNSQVENHETWLPLLLNNDYQEVYFDGLNRYFCAKEQVALKDFFKTPPNVFDGFIRYTEFKAINLLNTLKQNLESW